MTIMMITIMIMIIVIVIIIVILISRIQAIIIIIIMMIILTLSILIIRLCTLLIIVAPIQTLNGALREDLRKEAGLVRRLPGRRQRQSGTSRIRLIRSSNRMPCSSNVLFGLLLVVWRFFQAGGTTCLALVVQCMFYSRVVNNSKLSQP